MPTRNSPGSSATRVVARASGCRGREFRETRGAVLRPPKCTPMLKEMGISENDVRVIVESVRGRVSVRRAKHKSTSQHAPTHITTACLSSQRRECAVDVGQREALRVEGPTDPVGEFCVPRVSGIVDDLQELGVGGSIFPGVRSSAD